MVELNLVKLELPIHVLKVYKAFSSLIGAAVAGLVKTDLPIRLEVYRHFGAARNLQGLKRALPPTAFT